MPKAGRFSKNEQLAEKRSFEGNCEILRTIFQRARKGYIYFVTLRLISSMLALYCDEEKTVSGNHSTFVAKQI